MCGFYDVMRITRGRPNVRKVITIPRNIAKDHRCPHELLLAPVDRVTEPVTAAYLLE
jgi:hypothetical protein